MKEALAHVRDRLSDTRRIMYHILVVLLSAMAAVFFPAAAGAFLAYWSRIEDERIFLISAELIVAVVLIAAFNYIYRSFQDHRLAKTATRAGLVSFFPSRDQHLQKGIRHGKERQAIGRSVMVIGSTGYGTFVDPAGDLYGLLEKCTEAKVLLIDPYSEGGCRRVEALHHPDFTLEQFQHEVAESIKFLKRLRAKGKAVKLKLYADPPLVKLLILGDYLWLKHYHTDLDVQAMPEYVFRHNHDDHGLYTLFYQYFLQRWDSAEIPEYDFDTSELVYRGHAGRELTREPFVRAAGPKAPDRSALVESWHRRSARDTRGQDVRVAVAP